MASTSSRSSTTMDEDKTFLSHHERPISHEDHPYHIHSRLARSERRLNRWWSWTIALLVFNFLFFIVEIAVWYRVNTMLESFDCKRGDQFEPDLVYDTPVTFQPHDFLRGPPDNKTNDFWTRLAPPGEGVIEIPNHLTKGLPASRPSPNNPSTHTVYGISMFHQLHCLNFLRFAYWPDTVKGYPAREVEIHRDHCIDYIRQAIMCFGDATFEPVSDVGIHGMGVSHQCRNYDLIWTWAYDRRSNKNNGTGFPQGIHTHTPAKLNEDIGRE